MAAHSGQGRSFATFLVGLTIACAGIAYLSSGYGKLLLVIGAAVFLGSLFGFLKIKPQEGKPAQKTSSAGMKLLGAFLAALGWILTLFGMHIVDGTGGRIVIALIGIAVSLAGMIYVLPAAFNKNAIWKA